jgi:hypothetical protein
MGHSIEHKTPKVAINGSIKTGGMNEGIARAISQACVYPIETRKTLMQVYGNIPRLKIPYKITLRRWVSGLSTSCITAGIVFSTYFSVYNNFKPSPFAGSIAAFVTSFIKLPIGNSMRLMQCGTSNNIIHASQKLCKNEGMRGLYNGYGLCLIEDAIDMDLRVRLYNSLQNIHSNSNSKNKKIPHHLSCIGYGALSGAISCGLTTPFDTIRARMCFNTAMKTETGAIYIGKLILLNEGINGFYKGAFLRVTSNAVKSGLFFWFLNILELQKHNKVIN